MTKTKSRKTMLASEIRSCKPELALRSTTQEITLGEMGMFIKLAVCNHLKAACPQWVRSISKEQRAMLCMQAANFTPIVNPKQFWFRLKQRIYGTSDFRIIEG